MGKLEGEVNHERLWTLKNNLRGLKWQRGGRLGYQVVGIIEGTACMSTGCGEKIMNTVFMKINK